MLNEPLWSKHFSSSLLTWPCGKFSHWASVLAWVNCVTLDVRCEERQELHNCHFSHPILKYQCTKYSVMSFHFYCAHARDVHRIICSHSFSIENFSVDPFLLKWDTWNTWNDISYGCVKSHYKAERKIYGSSILRIFVRVLYCVNLEHQ